MTVDFRSIRAWNNSKNMAFEELCCQLAHCEDYAAGSRFARKGAPDAGVECFWILPDGTEHGWQAKYFFELGHNQRQQLDNSVKTALEKHPKLARYTVCLPLDLSDARDGRKWSQLRHWNGRVRKWREWARERGMNVEFAFWGQHELTQRLSHEKHAGRRFFWFRHVELSRTWLERHLSEAIAKTGPRYTPKLHVDLPIAGLFDALGRTSAFFDDVASLYGEVRKRWHRARWNFGSATVIELLGDRLKKLEGCLEETACLLTELQSDCKVPFPLDRLQYLCQSATNLASDCAGVLEREERPCRKADTAHDDETERRETEQAKRRHDAWNHAVAVCDTLYEFQELLDSDKASLADKPFLFLRGDAGQGKTHLLCDVATHRIERGAPTLLLLGQHFYSGDPWQQVVQQLHLLCSRDELLGALDAASEAAGVRGLIFIDALNEGSGRSLWRDHLPAFVEVIRRYRHLGLAITCRSSYVPLVAREDLVPKFMLDVEHPGFADHEFEATRSFFDHYGIQRPLVPLLQPEFRNPLFLKVFCEGLRRLGQRSIPKGTRGISKIFELFLDSIDAFLWTPERLDYPRGSRIVHQAVEKLAAGMDARGRHLRIDQAEAICSGVLRRDSCSKSLLPHLISEGALCEDIAYVEGDREPVPIVRFAYERFADHLVAGNLLDRFLDAGSAVGDPQAEPSLGDLFRDEWTVRQNSGLIHAIAVQLPERTGKELFDVVQCGQCGTARDAFFESLIWRAPESITGQTVSHFNALLIEEESRHDALDALVALSTIPEHFLNADALHKQLWDMPLAERDAFWSTYLSQRFQRKGPIDRLLDWAWPPDDARARDLDGFEDEPIRLAAVTLVWFLTTSDRFVRDRATKGLVSLLHDRLNIVQQLLQSFAGVNDPYVAERLYAVAYGCVMLSTDADRVAALARHVYGVQFAEDKPDAHILLRDYARGIVEYAHHIGCDLEFDVELTRPPYESDWPLTSRPFEELAAKCESWGHSSTESSLGDIGDFYCYTMSCLGDWSQRPLVSEPNPASSRPDIGTAGNETQRAGQVGIDAVGKWCESLNSDAQRLLRECTNVQGEEECQQKLEALLASLTPDEQRSLEEATSASRPAYDPEDHYDKSVARGWILQRVIELGWTPERFRDFDERVRRGVQHDTRTAHKAERIGKKYQWIALHEYLAHLADNCHFRGHRREPPDEYEGPWQIGERNIDPSLLLRQGHDIPWQTDAVSWWSPLQYSFETAAGKQDREWLRNWAAIPDPRKFIDVCRPVDGSAWLALRGYCAWYEQHAKHQEYDENDRRQVSLNVRGFLVPKGVWPQMLGWLRNGKHCNWDPPQGLGTLYTFLGEYPWARCIGQYGCNYPWINDEQDYEARFRLSPPHPVAVPAAEFHWERNYDCSCNETFSGYLPAPWMMKKLGLQWGKKALRIIDKKGELAAFDPSIEEPGPSTLLLSKSRFLEFVESEKLQLFWYVSSEKMIIQKDRNSENWPGRVMTYWVYALENDTVSLRCRLAVHTTVGPTEDVFLSEQM